ncbi:MAG: cupin domain-containing protein [Polyangiaceae bacterium]
MTTTVKHRRDIPAYVGPNAIPGIRFRAARAALGVTAWGMNVLELDPGTDGYPEHDHVGDGQEEVYIVLDGSVILRTGEEEVALRQGDMARVPPEVRRKLVTRESSAVVLAIGATPGKAFTPTM